MATINNSSDIGVTCGKCGSVFSGQARYCEELLTIFSGHWCMIPTLYTKDKPDE